MPKLWMNGRWERVAYVERGRPMVHSEKEWRELAKRRVVLYGVTFFGFGLAQIPFLIDGDTTLVLFIGLPFALFLCLLGLLLFGGWHLWTGGSTPGIYERGVELLWGRFVPYGEVMGTSRGYLMSSKQLMLQLAPSGRRMELDWMVFGVDGSDYVESMVGGAYLADAMMERPRLVVYPSGDASGSPVGEGPRGKIQY